VPVGLCSEVRRVLRGELRVETPDFLASVRVQRDHLAVRRAHVKHAVDFQRGVFSGGFARIVRARNVTGAVGPGGNEFVSIFRGDLRQWRVTIAMSAAAVGVPVTVGHGRGGVGHARYAVAVQLAFDFTGVGELAGQCRHASDHHGDAQRARAHRCSTGKQQRAAEPRQQHDDAKGEQQRQTRHQLPPVEADFPQCPDGAGEQHQCVEAQRSTAGRNQQHAGQRQANTGQQVVQRAAQHAQLDPPGQHGQAH
jgi:hypothetical protein